MVTVGAIVRIKREPPLEKYRGRAVVATDQNDQSKCVVFWESLAPKPLEPMTSFLVSPNDLPNDSDDDELIIDVDQTEELSSFETGGSPQTATIEAWKANGDELLKLGDPGCAIPYYERALALSSQVSIGSSVVVSVEGFPKIAEVDCLEEDTVEVMLTQSQEEKVIPLKDVLIAISEINSEEKMQERVLLNLARCLIQHSEIHSRHRTKYLKSAILACTLCMTISLFHQHATDPSPDQELPANAQTSLILRVKAQSNLAKWPHAVADAKRLSKCGNPQGVKLLESVQRQKKQQDKKDKTLVKAMSSWVQKATSSSVSQDEEGVVIGTGGRHSQTPSKASKSSSPVTSQNPSPLLSLLLIVVAIVIAIIIQSIQ